MNDNFKQISAFFPAETKRVFSSASQQKIQAMYEAERRKEIFFAWNKAVSQDSRNLVQHITGLFYNASDKKLTVYVDTPSWCQEISMQKHVFLTRMSQEGGSVEDIIFKVSHTRQQHPEFHTNSAVGSAIRYTQQKKQPRYGEKNIGNNLCESELAQIDKTTKNINNKELRESIKNAMIASFSLQKSKDICNKP